MTIKEIGIVKGCLRYACSILTHANLLKLKSAPTHLGHSQLL